VEADSAEQSVPKVETRQETGVEQSLPEKQPPAKAVKSTELACFTLGPFSQASLASQTAEAISALGITVERRQELQRTPRGYWVYLPSLKSYAEARDKVKEMKGQGLSDLFIMGKGSHQNAISLGLFKSKQAAQDRYKQVQAMGIDAILEVQYREKKQGWLDMSVPGDQTTAIAALSEMAEETPGINLTQRKCE
jgi:cell division septation protein DedD